MSRPAPLQLPRSRVAITAPPIAQRAPQAEDNIGAAAAPFALGALNVSPQPQRSAVTEVGPADDVHEREADAIARTVMRMPADVELQEAPEGVQRACAACEAEDKVQRLGVEEAEREHGPPDLAATPRQLTSGGAPLGAGLRGFYESRLGRDLSGVRIHQGGAAEAMADSISARAFTYGSHIWLGRGESAAPSETLSHEMAHVLQQTQPASLGDDAAEAGAAAPAAQRSARWVPLKPAAGEKDFEENRSGAHDAVIMEVSKDAGNADLLAEVPIPNGGFHRLRGRSNGYADFYKAEPALRLPGVIAAKDPAAKPSAKEEQATKEVASGQTELTPDDGPPEPPPDTSRVKKPHVPAPPNQQVENYDVDDWQPPWFTTWKEKNPKADTAGLEKAPISKGHRLNRDKIKQYQNPRVENDKVVGLDKAPTTIALGELKPGHNLKAREGGQKQLDRYIAGLTQVKEAVNAVKPEQRDGPGTWALKINKMSKGEISVPPGLHPRAAKPTFPRDLELKVKSEPLRNPIKAPGHLAFGKDPQGAGIWNYVFVPRNAPPTKKLTAGQSDAFEKHVKDLNKLIAKLKKNATKVKARRRAMAARPAKRHVIRRNTKPRKDSFELDAWEKDRKALAGRFNAWKSTDPGARTIEQQQAVREAYEKIAEEIKGVSAPATSAQERADSKMLHRLERIADRKFGPLLGKLRDKFGFIFVKLANAYDNFRKKLDDRKKRAPGDAPAAFAGWKKKAIRLLIKAATVGAGLLMEQVVQHFATCIDGLADQVVAKFEGELEENFGEEMDRIIDAFDTLRKRIETELD
ncbi:DUF4157 domain-containing protein, partial [Aestuariivirga sp.]|uniref:DUF4157 domain-containing protein n=1 Tax=Aestuariivirga sp. TaxID=2650926 RepID=UPI003782D6A8